MPSEASCVEEGVAMMREATKAVDLREVGQKSSILSTLFVRPSIWRVDRVPIVDRATNNERRGKQPTL